MPTNSNTTQRLMILTALKKGRTLTWLDAVMDFGCSKLSTRIGELERSGMLKNLDRGWRILENGKKVRTYRIRRNKKKNKG